MIGEYDRSSRASCLAALDACAPEQQSHGSCDESDAAEGAPDDCRDLLPFAAVAFRLGGQELRLRRRETRDDRRRRRRGRKGGHGRWFARADLFLVCVRCDVM